MDEKAKEILTEKRNLVNSETYKKIRAYRLDEIVELSNSQIEPVILKGMLKEIHDTDKWEEQFNKEKKKIKE